MTLFYAPHAPRTFSLKEYRVLASTSNLGAGDALTGAEECIPREKRFLSSHLFFILSHWQHVPNFKWLAQQPDDTVVVAVLTCVLYGVYAMAAAALAASIQKGQFFFTITRGGFVISPWDSSKFALYLMPCSSSTNLDVALFRCYIGLCRASLANNSTICEGTSVKQQAAPCLFRSHRRVDSLQDGNQQLDLETELGDALTLMRSNLLGY